MRKMVSGIFQMSETYKMVSLAGPQRGFEIAQGVLRKSVQAVGTIGNASDLYLNFSITAGKLIWVDKLR